jgi:AraC-like DNA-binding protein
MDILYLSASVLTLFFIVILLGKKGKVLSDRILLCWLLLLFSNVFSFYLIRKDSAPSLLVIFLDSTPFLHGPLIWLYTSAVTGILKKNLMPKVIHVLPFTVFFICGCLIKAEGKDQLDHFSTIIVILKFILPFIYIMFSLKFLKQFRKIIPDLYSSVSEVDLKWLSIILNGGIVLILIGAITLLIDRFTGIKIPQYGGLYLNMAYCICIILLGYYGFRQTTVFIPSGLDFTGVKEWEKPSSEKLKAYQSQNRNEETCESDYSSLLKLMESDKPYTDPDLTLSSLAQRINLSENRLSYIINSRSGKNFFEFVNSYRIAMVISRIKNGEHKKSTLLGLALESGFNSKASFNRAFRKFTGMTPSEFIRRMNIGLDD